MCVDSHGLALWSVGADWLAGICVMSLVRLCTSVGVCVSALFCLKKNLLPLVVLVVAVLLQVVLVLYSTTTTTYIYYVLDVVRRYDKC